MKVVIAAEIFTPEIGGPATYSKQLATELSARGWEVRLICYSNQPVDDSYIFKVFRVIRSRFKPWHYYQYYKKLKELAKDCDLIYAMGPVGSGRPAMKVSKELNKKLVVKVTGDYAWEQARVSQTTDVSIDEFQQKVFSGRIGLLQKTQRTVCHQANKVIVPSQYLKKIVEGWGIAPDKISVVYNSFIPSQTSRQVNTDEDLIVSIGRLVPWKGFSLLIEVVSELVQVNSKFKLLILGSGPEKDYLNLKIKGLNLSDHVKIELVDHQDRDHYLSQAKMFTLNTGYEGLSHTILEAFSAGVPVITTNVGGNPELIRDGHNGLLVPYNNKQQLKEAILMVDQDEDMRQKFIGNSKEILRQFTFEKMIDDTINVLLN